MNHDRDRLRAALIALTPAQRVAFAAGCVEVLMPAYARSGVGDPAFFRATLDAVWERPVPDDLPSPEAVQALMPEEDDGDEWAPQAEDATAAMIYLLELIRDDDPDRAVYAAERAYASADEYAARSMDLDVVGERERRALLGSPPVRAELKRQAAALTATATEIRAAAVRLPVGGRVPDQ